MTEGEIAAQQKMRQELVKARIAAERSVDSIDWTDCEEALDGLRRTIVAAIDETDDVDSSKATLANCLQFPSVSDLLVDGCQNQRNAYQNDRSSASSALETVNQRVRQMNEACGIAAR